MPDDFDFVKNSGFLAASCCLFPSPERVLPSFQDPACSPVAGSLLFDPWASSGPPAGLPTSPQFPVFLKLYRLSHWKSSLPSLCRIQSLSHAPRHPKATSSIEPSLMTPAGSKSWLLPLLPVMYHEESLPPCLTHWVYHELLEAETKPHVPDISIDPTMWKICSKYINHSRMVCG